MIDPFREVSPSTEESDPTNPLIIDCCGQGEGPPRRRSNYEDATRLDCRAQVIDGSPEIIQPPGDGEVALALPATSEGEGHRR